MTITEAELRRWIAEKQRYDVVPWGGEEYSLRSNGGIVAIRETEEECWCHFEYQGHDYLHDLNAAWMLVDEARRVAFNDPSQTWPQPFAEALMRGHPLDYTAAGLAALICRLYYEAHTGEQIEVTE